MIKRAGGLVALPLLAALNAPLSGQDVGELCKAVSKLSVGQWASFNVTGGKMSGGAMRLAIVGSERSGDTTLYWYEISMKDPKQGASVMQMLVPGIGSDATGIRGLVIKSGNQPAMKMPQQMMGMMSQQMSQNPAAETARRCAGAQAVGWESLTVPAGPMRALHIKTTEGGDAWVSKDVPFGLVKMHGTQGDEAVLTGHGLDAKSSIAEKPQEMPGMGRRP